LTLIFNKASETNVYEYTVIRPDKEFNLTAARWISINSVKTISLSSSAAPKGSTIYVRKKGIEAYASKNVELVLSSAIGSFTVEY
jgi:hypothetical protein